MGWRRALRHLLLPPWHLRRVLPGTALASIEAAVAASERRHGGQIRVAIESALDVGPLWRGQHARERALEVFSRLGVWDTERNNGVLIYLLLADRDVEIVADRGIAARVTAARWEAICRAMEAEFRAGRFEQGLLAGVAAVGVLLAEHFPTPGSDRMADAPALL